MNRGIGIEPGEQAEQFGFGGVLGQHPGLRGNAQAGGCFFLHPNINPRGRVFAHADKHQAGLDAAGVERGHAPGRLLMNLFSDGAAVNEVARRHQGMRSTV